MVSFFDVKNRLYILPYLNTKNKRSWSRGLVKSRQKNGRDSRTRETEVGEKIAVTKVYSMSAED